MLSWTTGFFAMFVFLAYAVIIVLLFWLATRFVKASENIADSLRQLVQIQKEKQ